MPEGHHHEGAEIGSEYAKDEYFRVNIKEMFTDFVDGKDHNPDRLLKTLATRPNLFKNVISAIYDFKNTLLADRAEIQSLNSREISAIMILADYDEKIFNLDRLEMLIHNHIEMNIEN
ncbi:MAG: hypothetical protein WCO23_03385 [bacterium]